MNRSSLRGSTGLVLVAVSLALAAGCRVGGTDDEMARPDRTVTVSPTASPAAVPSRIPVGSAGLSPGSPVRAEGSTLRVGKRTVQLAPLQVDSPVVAPGGVYFRNRDELWFTDLGTARATGFARVSGLTVSRDGSVLSFLDDASSPGVRRSYDTTTGDPVSPSR